MVAKPEARDGARGARSSGQVEGPAAPRGSGQGRLRAAAALGAHRLSSSTLLSCLPLPSLASRAPATPTPARLRKGPVFPLLSQGTASSHSFVSPSLLSPNAATTSCHRPSSQQGGSGSGDGGGGPSCRNSSRGRGKLTPTYLLVPPPRSPLRTPSASLRNPPWSITGSVVHASSSDFEATPILVTVARKGKLAFAQSRPRSQV